MSLKNQVQNTGNTTVPIIENTEQTNTTSFYQRLSFRMGVGVVIFVILVLLANYYVAQTRGREVIAEQVNKLNDEVGQAIILKLSERLIAAETLTTALSNLGLALPKDEKLFRKLIPYLIDNAGMKDLIAGGGVWPEPNRFKDGVERHSFFWGRNEQGILEFYDDYNAPEGKGYHHEEWYVPARYLEKGKVYWSKSYMDPYSHEPMVTCTMPMWDENGFQGVATIDLKLVGLSKFMAEQAKLIGGYAFAVDRNNRLLSFPKEHEDYFLAISQNEFPTMHALVEEHAAFGEMYIIFSQIDKKHLRGVNSSRTTNLLELTRNIAADSYQIDRKEASMIAAMLLGEQYLSSEGERFQFESDPILNEPVSIRVLTMPKTGWKLVVTMPIKYTDTVVSEITEQMLSLLFVLLTLTTIVYVMFFKTAFLSPVHRLTYQVRRLVSREDYVTKLELNGADELSQLANWFNIRTAKLGDVLEKLKIKNTALDESRLDSEQANRAKNIFLASMSHDIRTPMNAIIGMSDILSKSTLNLEQSNYARVINTSAQALISLINDIMDFSKIEANQLDLENRPFNLRETLDDCADLISFQAIEKNLEFIYFLSPDINPNVIGDPGRIRQIILNLAGNALKFTSSGRVELWVESIRQSSDKVNLHIEVRDTGIGLSPSAQETLYSPFAQGDSSTTRKFGGTGLGLTISKHLAELMGGVIDYRSEEGVGTTFTFNLKLKTNEVVSKVSSDVDSVIGATLLVLGQNHFQNAVIERYAEVLFSECCIYTHLQSWLDALEHHTSSDCYTLCTDQGLLGEIIQLKNELPPTLDHHKMIVLKAQNDVFLEELAELKPYIFAVPLSMPIKFNALKERMNLKEVHNVRANERKSSQLLGKGAGATTSLSLYKNKQLLVVEDNKVNQQVILIMLNHLGLSADIANDGIEAVEALNKKDYDLVLMDWQMPRMDGLEATRRIRALKIHTQPIIIAVTANAMSGDIEKCMDAGMDDYLSKPIRREKIETILTKWLVKIGPENK